MHIIVFLIMNSIIILSSFLLTAKVLKISNLVEFFISFFIFYMSQIILTELLLGIFGILYLDNVLLSNSIILLFVWLFTRKHPSYLNLHQADELILELLNNKIMLLLISIISIFALVKLGINLVNPPFGWDSLNYHFVFPVEWLKQGNLNMPITISDDPSPSYYPINGSLFYLWLILPFRNVFLADLGQLPFFILAFLATYGIARIIGINRDFSFSAACLFILIPNFFKQLSVAYVDVMVAALFLTCLFYLFLLNTEFFLRYVLLYSLSLSLLLGTKTIASAYTILLLIPFIYLCFKNKKRSYLLINSLFIIIILGGFTYIRNFLETGNPLYPLDFRLFGKIVFKGVMDIKTYSAHFKIEDYGLSKLLFHEGLGLQSLIFILPGIFLALPIAIVKKRKFINFNLGYFFILPILIYLVYRFVIPLANTRYLYALLGTGIILGFYVAKILNLKKWIINILIILSGFASMAELAKRQELVVSTIFTILLFVFLLFLRKYFKENQLIKTPFFIVPTLIFIILSLIILEQDYIKNEFPRYKKMVKYSGFWPDATEAWDWLNQNTSGNNIAYIGRPVSFPLYGSGFKNNVDYVSVNKIEPAKLHYFPNSYYRWGFDFESLHRNLEVQGNYRSDADYSVWLSNLSQRNIDYLFVYSLHQIKAIEFPLEDKWALMHPEKFNLVFANQTIHIYKIFR